MGIIEARDIHVHLDSTHALRGIDIDVNQGEILSIVGPNGSGKTTLLKLLGGLLRVTSGELKFKGQIITDENRVRIRKRATVVFQKPVHFGTTVFKNIAYGLRIRGFDEDEITKRVKEALSFVGLEDKGEKHARNLSGGEQRRVSIARAIVLEPEILLLDEPTADLDIDSTRIVEDILKKINKEHETTIIVSTHNLFQAESIAHRTAIIDRGQIQMIGRASAMLGFELEKLSYDGVVLNTFKGNATWLSESNLWRGLLRINLAEGVFIEAIGTQDGHVTIWIPPQDVIVSKKTILSSARNTLKGKILRIEVTDSTTLLTVDVGVEIAALITENSLKDFDIKIGDSVYVTFKASSVSVY
ncbi:MAG: ABC transporter ATP-binding protein [Candidatus Thorarchaeota archaeon]|jgi:tungstate transport system ATP-binding protein